MNAPVGKGVPILVLAVACALPTCDGRGVADGAGDGDRGAEGESGEGEGEGDAGIFPDVARVLLPSSFAVQDNGWALTTGDEIFDVGTAFYQNHDDVYDMLLVFTEKQVADIFAFSVPLVAEGPGLAEVRERYGWADIGPSTAGSAGKLQHIALMNDRTIYDGAAFTAQDIVVHEVGHRWSAYLFLPDVEDEDVLTDEYWSHWSVYANVGGPSALGYGELIDESNGQFSFQIRRPLRYSMLELYQQGLVSPDEVVDLFFVEGAADFFPTTSLGGDWGADSYGEDVRYSGTRHDFTLDDIIARNGPNAVAQTAYRMAFVIICADQNACDVDALAFVDAQRLLWPDSFAAATDGRATADTSL
jgi:hypothetical protein